MPNEDGNKLIKKIKLLLEKHSTIVLYESPHRLMKLLLELKDLKINNRNISISREISKIHEESINGSIDHIIKHFSQKIIKGEIVVVIDKLD